MKREPEMNDNTKTLKQVISCIEKSAENKWKLDKKLTRLLEPKVGLKSKLLQITKGLKKRIHHFFRVKLGSKAHIKHSISTAVINPNLIDNSLTHDPHQTKLTEQLHGQALSLAKKIPASDGSEYFSKFDLKVAIVTDEYMYNYYKDCFSQLTLITSASWANQLDQGFDLFIYVSCWEGAFKSGWKGNRLVDSEVGKTLRNIVKKFKQKNIPTVFQSIEDPSNFDHFLDLSRHFDFIFTTDVEKVDHYKAATGNSNVFWGEYGINPLFHNPIGSLRDKLDGIFFAGSYPKRYKTRCQDMERIFDAAVEQEKNLIIADRNLNRNLDGYEFPKKYLPFVVPPIDHNLLQNVHKIYNCNINLNSIKNSPTMCAMRVYELQALGVSFISNYSNATNSMFPLIPQVHFKQQFERLSAIFDENHLNICARRLRDVMSTRTAYDQTNNMLNKIFKGKNKSIHEKKILLVYSGSRKFSWSIDITKAIEPKDLDKIDIFEYDYLAQIDSELEYDYYYLEDLLNGFKFTDSDYVSNCPSNLEQSGSKLGHEYCRGRTRNPQRTMFSLSKAKKAGSLTFEDIIGNAHRGYVVPEISYKQQNEFKPEGKLTVIVPIYNNGMHLLGKAFRSLISDPFFPSMEILLIDDGSSCKKTLEVLHALEKSYSNVSTYFFPTGGSGSASRPRNQGIKMAATKYLTFLDPDNEIAGKSFYELYNKIENLKLDFVSCFNYKISKSVGSTCKFQAKTYQTPKELLLSRSFPAIASQAALFDSKFLKNSNITFAEGTIGQDTLFSYEVLAMSKKCAFFNGTFLVYYADTRGSVTNTLDSKFIKKSIALEKQQVLTLKKYDLLVPYIEVKFNYFLLNWYWKKVKLMKEDMYDEGTNMIIKICKIYQNALSEKNVGQ